MKRIILLFTLIGISAALAACSMDTTGGFQHGDITMNKNEVYDPNFGL